MFCRGFPEFGRIVEGVVIDGVVGFVSPTRRALTFALDVDVAASGEPVVVAAGALSYEPSFEDVIAGAADVFPGAAAAPGLHTGGSD